MHISPYLPMMMPLYRTGAWETGALQGPNYAAGNIYGRSLAQRLFYPQAPVLATPAVGSGKMPFVWQNRLKALFHNRQAVVYALHLRTFAAQDRNRDGKIDPVLGENGNFLRAISLLPELKALGVNAIHLLPITPVGKIDRLGEFGSPGSVYAPAAYDRLNAEYDEPNNGLTVVEEARLFVEVCHRLGIHVMVDIPSGASPDLAEERPDLIARDAHGRVLVPKDWIDLRAFVRDTPALRAYYEKFFDLMINQVGVDGFRADIARARTPAFWRHFIAKYPDKAWLAETYTTEDASPIQNVPRDIPEELLKAGFDAIYGQFHIFQDMNADEYIRYLQQNQAMLRRVGTQKSLIGSFLTHDDPSAMTQGGALYCKLIAGLMAVQPDTNPYILDGFTTGFKKPFDIFNWRPRPVGRNPEIGQFLQQMLQLRRHPKYGPILTQGNFIPLQVSRMGQDKKDPGIIAFLRQYQGRTLLIVANKDVNAAHEGMIYLPGLQPNQRLVNLAPNYGEPSTLVLNPHYSPLLGEIRMKIERGRFYVFELSLPTFYS